MHANRLPETRLKVRVRPDWRSQGASRAVNTQHRLSTENSIAMKVVARMANCGTNAACGSMNCGKKAEKNSRALGLLAPTIQPCRNSERDERVGASGLAAASTARSALMNVVTPR